MATSLLMTFLKKNGHKSILFGQEEMLAVTVLEMLNSCDLLSKALWLIPLTNIKDLNFFQITFI